MLNLHSLGNKPVVKYAYKVIKAWRQYGFAAMLRMVKFRIASKAADKSGAASGTVGELYGQLLKKYQDGEIRGIAIIPSAFEFDELYNQRTINLSKYLSNNGYGVIYVAWQWHKGEVLEKNYQYVFKNVIQIPLYEFIETHSRFKIFSELTDKKYIVMLPAKVFSDLVFFMKDNCFDIYYDIMDDWECFFKVGQAPWYVKEIEEFVVLNSNKITAVSEPLVQKFSHLRQDITLVGNGYYPELLGKVPDHEPASSYGKKNKITIGYFGHLTESWFDWEMMLKMLQRHEELYFEVIGYGESEAIRNQISGLPNVKLLGKISPRDLREYAGSWDIAVIPFKKSKLAEAVDPIKIYEYLYFGLPTVVTGIPHLQSFPFVKVTDNEPESFYTAIMELYENKSSFLKAESFVDGFVGEGIPATDTKLTEPEKPSTKRDKQISDFLADKTWDKRFDIMFKPDFISAIYKD